VDYIQKEATHAFADRVRNQELKQQLFMGGYRSLNQALKLEAAAGPTATLREVRLEPLWERGRHQLSAAGKDDWNAGSVA
jgi:hypothetical protein